MASRETGSDGGDEQDGADAAQREQNGGQGHSRRQFLTGAGIAATGLAVGGAAGAVIGASIAAANAESEIRSLETDRSQIRFDLLQPRNQPGFDHLVVVMFENRSLDNLLGYLYDAETIPKGKTYNGLAFGKYSNKDEAGNSIAAHPYQGETDFVMHQPSPDPGEVYYHVNTQLFDVIDPPENAALRGSQILPPFNAPKEGTKPTMSGFVHDYMNDLRVHSGIEPQLPDYRVVMGAFTPDMLPVFSTLAQEFAIYDDWHAAVPSQTLCNRSFFHAATSHGFVSNSHGPTGISKWLDSANASPTVFNRLEEAKLPWAIYFDDRQLISLTGFLHAPVLEKYWKTNFRTMTQFYSDVANGDLPAYSFIEPRLLYDHNDMHPPVGYDIASVVVDGDVITGASISDVRAGDALLHRIYSAIRGSKSATGSNAMNTMLFVTFDEHGGTYDHVPPGPAVPPGDGSPGEMNFRFNRLGVRVPAIAISAYTARNTIIHDEMHHSSVVATLSQRFGLTHLTRRDRAARTIDNAVNLRTPRQPQDWPDTHPQYVPPNPESSDPVPAGDDDRPLAPPGAGLMGLLVAKYGAPGEPVPTTYRQAFDFIKERGMGLFGSDRIPNLERYKKSQKSG
jgi:phospholipase C